MTNTSALIRILLCGLILAGCATCNFAQTASPPAEPSAPPSAPVQRSEADLEKLVGPIALYPDPLLATLLPASAYPLEIVQVARFIKDTNNISKVDTQSWDQNVKALARFPDVITKMNDDLDWTSELGQAFVDDQKGVMEAIQTMRGKAQQAGNLKTTPQQVVVVTNTVIEKTVEQKVVVVTNTVVEIQPAQPSVIYVPTYAPAVVYAPPPPGEVVAASVISFGVGMAVGAVIANNCNWHSGGVYHGNVNVNVNVNRNVNVNQNANINRNANVNRSANLNQNANAQKWQADSNRRGSVSSGSAQSRGWGGQEGAARAPSSPGASAGHSAFGNTGGAAQTRQASTRGSSSRGGGGLHRR